MSRFNARRTLGLAALWVVFAAGGYFGMQVFGPDAETAGEPLVNVSGIETELPDLNGEPRRLQDFNDGPMLVNVWATWCAPCRREIPLLIDLQERFGDAGLTVLGVAIDDAAAVAEYAADMQINYPLLIGEEDAVSLISQMGAEMAVMPLSLFVDATGDVTRVFLGEIHEKEALAGLRGLLPDTVLNRSPE